MTTPELSPHEKFQAAHKAWRAATDAYDARMRDIMAGGPQPDGATILAECAELERPASRLHGGEQAVYPLALRLTTGEHLQAPL